MSVDQQNLVVRPARMDDLDEIAAFNARIHDDQRLPATIIDLIALKKIPSIERGFTVVRDPASGAVVSSTCLIPHTIRYAGIAIKAGMPELVGTDAAFRRRGLVSRQFDLLHRWSEENGDDLQIIGGIPNFYRQYGYEMTVSLEARRTGCLAALEALPDVEPGLVFQLAQESDIPDLMRLFAQETERCLLAHDWSELDWHYTLADERNNGCAAKWVYMIRRADGTLLGAVKYQRFIDEGRLVMLGAEIDSAGTTWDEVQPALLKHYAQMARQAAEEQNKPVLQVGLQAPAEHPLSPRTARIFPNVYAGYAWYVRIPYLIAFINKIKPALEENLGRSAYAGSTRTLKVNLYSTGLIMEIERGKINQITSWQPESSESGDFLCPEKVFYHLIFGHRTTAQIHTMFADCYGKKDAAEFMDACFPQRSSCLFPAL